ncbi:MAG TPA: hypothetical protein VFB84_11055 [Micromonosporaceae bacterium]|nr:hypothetical protein [Micromonosporaceae bacterium]
MSDTFDPDVAGRLRRDAYGPAVRMVRQDDSGETSGHRPWVTAAALDCAVDALPVDPDHGSDRQGSDR